MSATPTPLNTASEGSLAIFISFKGLSALMVTSCRPSSFKMFSLTWCLTLAFGILISARCDPTEHIEPTLHELSEQSILQASNVTVIDEDGEEGNETTPRNLCFCGQANRPRIVGGPEAFQHEFPWLVYMHIKKGAITFFCEGVLVTNRHVITAARCTSRAVPSGVTVFLGDHDRSNEEDGTHVKVDAVKIVQHPDFTTSPAIVNDIAIVTLKYAVRFSANVRPICFPPANFQFSNFTPVVAGWGAVRPGGDLSNILRKVNVSLIANDVCKTQYQFTSVNITSKMICAGGQGRDICSGDEGGPLMVSKNGRHYVVGITSIAAGCGSPQFPGVYTRLDSFRDFISRNTRFAIYCSL